MKLYRKNPQENEAIQFDGANADEIINWANGLVGESPMRNETGLVVATPSGPLTVDKGDWVVRGAPDDFYPVTADKFAALYSIPSDSETRTANNAVRHQYKVLSDQEKQDMLELKDMGAAFLNKCNELQPHGDAAQGRAYALAKTKVEEAVMWSVKGVTG